MHYHVSVKKLSNLLIPYSARLHEERGRNAWAAISRTPTYNVIPVKLKVVINKDTSVQLV